MIIINKSSLLEQLIHRGDQVSVVNGKLIIQPISNQPIPSNWLVKNKRNLIVDIATLFKLDIYQYESYSTGCYGKHKSGGISLQFINLRTGGEAYAVFNAEVERARSSKKYKAGSRLPGGQFRITVKHLFYKFWCSTGLNLPPRLSSFHDYMGKLKQVFFIPNPDHKGKITAKIIPLMNVTHDQICSRLNCQLASNDQTVYTQQSDKEHTSLPDKEMTPPVENRDVESNSSTGVINYGSRYNGNVVISNPLPDINELKTPQEQTHDEWLNDFDNA